MIYCIRADITLDTRTNKVVIETGVPSTGNYKRTVLFPGKKRAEHWVDVVSNDRHFGALNYAKDLCKFLCQHLHGRKEIKIAVKNVNLDNIAQVAKHA